MTKNAQMYVKGSGNGLEGEVEEPYQDNGRSWINIKRLIIGRILQQTWFTYSNSILPFVLIYCGIFLTTNSKTWHICNYIKCHFSQLTAI